MSREGDRGNVDESNAPCSGKRSVERRKGRAFGAMEEIEKNECRDAQE